MNQATPANTAKMTEGTTTAVTKKQGVGVRETNRLPTQTPAVQGLPTVVGVVDGVSIDESSFLGGWGRQRKGDGVVRRGE